MNSEMYEEWIEWLQNVASLRDLEEALATRKSLILSRKGNLTELAGERDRIKLEIEKRRNG